MSVPSPRTVASAASLWVLVVLAPAARAHDGPRIWLNTEQGRVTTYAGAYPPPFPDPPSVPESYLPARVFTQQLTDEDDVWFTEFPGFQRVPGGTVAPDTLFSYDIAGPLAYYRASTGSAPGLGIFESVTAVFGDAAPRFSIANELLQVTYTDDGFVAGYAAFSFNGSPGDHNHLEFVLFGNGTDPGGGPDGVYLLPLSLRADGFEPAHTLLLFGKNVSADELGAAAFAARHPVVPEPSGLLALPAAYTVLARRIRRP